MIPACDVDEYQTTDFREIIDTKSITKKIKQKSLLFLRLFSFKINNELSIIFYPFQHIVLSNIEVIPNSSRTRDLYLTLVQAAAENNNGNIIGNSTGATFVFNLPIRDRKTQSFRALVNIKAKSKKILVDLMYLAIGNLKFILYY
jgi:hypothetical protein